MDDPLHRFVELAVGAEECVVEHVADFDGTLHVWACSESFDPRVRIEVSGRAEPLEDEDSGGGTTCWTALQVAPGDALSVRVLSASEVGGRVELHMVAAPETEVTRAAAHAGQAELEALQALQQQGELAEARERVAIVVETLRGVDGAKQSEALAEVLWDVGMLAYETSALEPAALAWGSAHGHRERLLPPDHEDLLDAKLGLAAARKDLGDLAGARELEEQVHAARERLLPPDHEDLLDNENNLAATRYALGDLAGAHELFEHVHAARERLLPPDHKDLLDAKHNLAVTRWVLGDLVGAHELLEQVHAARARLLPPDHPDLLAAKLNLATMREALGDPAGAHELYEHVHAARERLLPPDDPDFLAAKQGLAVTRKARGDLVGALELEEYVHAARERLLPPDHPDLLTAKQNLASTRYELGDLAGAHELYEHVHAARERLLPPDHPGLLLAEQNLAATRRELGDLAGAHELFEHVHAARERLLPPDHPDLLDAQENLALTRHALGDRAGTRSLTRSLLAGQLAIASRLRGDSPRVAHAAAGGELRRLSAALFFGSSGDTELTGELAGLETELFAVVENLRAVSTSSPEVALAAARYAELGLLRGRLAEARGRLSDHVAAAPAEAAAIESWRQGIVQLADERDRLEHELRAALAERGVVLAEISAASVARGLEEGEALASFFRYVRYFDRDPRTGATPPALDSLLAFVVTPDAKVRRVELGAAATIEELVQRWRAGMGKPVSSRGIGAGGAGGTGDNGTADEPAGLELRKALLDPCLALMGDRPTTLHVVLDDFLHMVPLEALPNDESGVLGDELDLRLEPTVVRLVTQARPLGEGDRLVVLGGIDFDADSVTSPSILLAAATLPIDEMRAGAPGSLMALPETEVEVEALAKLHESLVGGESVVLTKAAATKAALLEHAPRARFLHLATHGWFAAESVASTLDVLETRATIAPTLDRAETTVQGFAPETLCGLALAGANRGVDEHGKVPGIATAEEIAALDLSSCELAVLSACETNVGLRRAGQGIQSLQTALHAAGARTAITSLWKVDDAATRKLFELFYTGLWDEGLGKAEALRRAQKHLREAGHPPRDWAAWVLSGDPD